MLDSRSSQTGLIACSHRTEIDLISGLDAGAFSGQILGKGGRDSDDLIGRVHNPSLRYAGAKLVGRYRRSTAQDLVPSSHILAAHFAGAEAVWLLTEQGTQDNLLSDKSSYNFGRHLPAQAAFQEERSRSRMISKRSISSQ